LIKKITLKINPSINTIDNFLFLKFFEENIIFDGEEKIYKQWIHRNLNTNLSEILLYDIQNMNIKKENNDNKLKKLITRNNINYFKIEKNVETELLHDKIYTYLDEIFKQNYENINIIIQFNNNYYNKYNLFDIKHKIEDTILYVNKEYDIIYSNKNCMHMLYEIIKSKYFKEYLKEQSDKKGKLFKIFYKRLFYEYLEKIFKIINI